MGAAIIGLIGVVLGVCLGAGYEEWKTWKNRKKLKAALIEELRSNLQMVPQKRNIVEQIIGQLKKTGFYLEIAHSLSEYFIKHISLLYFQILA